MNKIEIIASISKLDFDKLTQLEKIPKKLVSETNEIDSYLDKYELNGTCFKEKK